MNREFEMRLALATYANIILSGRDDELDIEERIAHYCYGVQFITPPVEGISGSIRTIASNASEWFKYLKDRDARRVRLHFQNPTWQSIRVRYDSPLLRAGENWFVEVQYDDGSDLYLTDYNPPKDNFMSPVKRYYVLLEHDSDHFEDDILSVTEARSKLGSVLKRLSEFAGRFEYTRHWVDNFNSSLITLENYEPSEDDDFLPPGVYSQEARQLIATIFASGFFGGMGSWSDFAFNGADEDLYQSLTSELYVSLCEALVSSASECCR